MNATTKTNVGGLNVSRETLELLAAYEAEVRRWNTTVNLVSRSSLEGFWARHIEDSAQIFAHCPEHAVRWVDLGSGAGLPGLIVAILAKEQRKELHVVLVEADKRKSVFLRQIIQRLGLGTELLTSRIESLPPLEADVISARALAPLGQLLAFALPHLQPNGTALFLKGARYGEEVSEARKFWDFDLNVSPSLSQPDAALLTIRKLDRAKPS